MWEETAGTSRSAFRSLLPISDILPSQAVSDRLSHSSHSLISAHSHDHHTIVIPATLSLVQDESDSLADNFKKK